MRTVEIGYRNTPKNKVDKEAVMLTDDENIIDIQFAVQYNLNNAEAYVFNNRKPDDIVAYVAETAIREVVGTQQDGLRAVRRTRPDRDRTTRKLMQQMLDHYGTGVAVQQVTLQNVQPPEKVQAAFDDAVKASQDRDRLKNEGQAYANDVIPRARGTAARLMRGGQRLRTAVVIANAGRCVAFQARSWSNTRRRRCVTRDRLYLDMMQSVLGNSSKVLVDQKAGQQPALPAARQADQGIRCARGGNAGHRAGPGTDSSGRTTSSADPTASSIDPRSRDALRNREGR